MPPLPNKCTPRSENGQLCNEEQADNKLVRAWTTISKLYPNSSYLSTIFFLTDGYIHVSENI
jgi:hypothetical protein